MPRLIKAWACEFRCGRRVTTKRKGVEDHERTCFMNPARRSCKTCKHEGFDSDYFPYEDWIPASAQGVERRWRECGHDDEELLPEKPENGMAIRFDCPGWEVKS